MNFYELLNEQNKKMHMVPFRKRHLPVDIILDEDKSIKWNREKVAERNREIDEFNQERAHTIREIENVIESKIKEDISKQGFSEQRTEIIFQQAYDMGHHAGYVKVYEDAMELCDFLKKFK